MSNTITLAIPPPPPKTPLMTRVVSNPIWPDNPSPLTWILGEAHPLLKDMKVMRMLFGEEGIEVYSISGDGRSGMRNTLPIESIRISEEVMPPDVFVQELEFAQSPPGSDSDEEDEEELDAEPSSPQQNASSTNGQAVS